VVRAFVLIALATPALVHAQERRIELHLDDCLGADAAAVRRIAAAEIGEELIGFESERDGVEPAPPGEIPALVIRADCGVESAVVVASHAPTRVRLERRVELIDAALNARTRLLALSIAELAASAWAAVDAVPPPVVEPPVAPEPEPAPPLLRDRIRRTPIPPRPPDPVPTRPIGVRAVAVARVSGTPVHISGGGGIGVEIGLPFMLGIGGDFRYEQGEADGGALGSVTLRVAWGTLLALVRPVVGWSSITIGVGAKIGAAWLEGNPESPAIGADTHAGAVFGPAIVAYGSLHLAGAGYVHVGLELAWVTVGVAGLNGATGEEIASFAGPQIAITAGFEIQPSR
jgi:hypothetical protein